MFGGHVKYLVRSSVWWSCQVLGGLVKCLVVMASVDGQLAGKPKLHRCKEFAMH